MNNECRNCAKMPFSSCFLHEDQKSNAELDKPTSLTKPSESQHHYIITSLSAALENSQLQPAVLFTNWTQQIISR